MTTKTKEEVLTLAMSVKNGDNDAFRELEGVARPLLVSLSNKFSRFHYKFEFDDFYSIGLLALYKACLSFREGNPSFLNYAKLVIVRAFWREIEYWNQNKRNVFENSEVEIKESDDLYYNFDMDDVVFTSDFRSNVDTILDDCFNEKKSQILKMYFLQNMKVVDIANELRLNYKQVHKTIERGTKKVKVEYVKRYFLDKSSKL
jgi:RNA polymerase sigma factor (sigma-70 family)